MRQRNVFPTSGIANEHSRIFQNVEMINSTLGKFSYVQKDSVIYNSDIGQYCSIASDVKIGLAEHPTNYVSTSPVFYDPTQPLPRFFAKEKVFEATVTRTKIESDVWVGAGAIIKSGVTVGVGAVIGAGAIVTKDVSPYSIVVGNPACEIRKRFSDLQISRLIKSEWWKLDEEYLSKIWRTFLDLELFLEEVERK